MFKRIIAVALAALLLVSMAVIAVSAADGNESAGADANNSAGADTNSEASGASNVVKFDPSGIWSNISTVYCHIWPIGKDSFYGWQANAEKCEKVGATYQYDLDKLNDSDYISGGLQSGVDYCIIFSADTGVETYGCTFGPDCAGDTLYLTGNKIENTEDSTKKSDEAVFEDHTNYGPHLAFTSIGNVVGKSIPSTTTAYDMLVYFLADKGKSGLMNALNFQTDKTAQQIIDSVAGTLNLTQADVTKAIKQAAEVGNADTGDKKDWSSDWDASKSSLPAGESGGSTSGDSSSKSSSGSSSTSTSTVRRNTSVQPSTMQIASIAMSKPICMREPIPTRVLLWSRPLATTIRLRSTGFVCAPST